MPDTKISADPDAGTLDGTEMVPLLTVGAAVNAGSFVVGSAYFILSVGTTDFTLIGAASNTVGLLFTATGAGSGTGTAGPAENRRKSTQAIADLAGGGGLWSGAISAVPTSANTGLTTWLNQDGATVNDRATGITLAKANPGNVDGVRGRTKTPALSAPYTVSALVALAASTLSASQNSTQAGIGWYDGTNKLHLINIAYSGGWLLVVGKWNTVTTILGNDYVGPLNMVPGATAWLHIVDDGTNVKFGYSKSGAAEDAHILFSVAKASGHLGASGYSNLLFFANANDCDIRATLMSWTEAAGAAF